MQQAHYLALGANLSFSIAAVFLTIYSKRLSVLWMNAFKSLVAFFACVAWVVFISGWKSLPNEALLLLLMSGFLGLNIADLFLLNSFTRLGPSRSLMIFGLQPFFLSVGGYLLFAQTLNMAHAVGLLFMLSCLFCVSLEQFRNHGKWELKGISLAITAVLLDGVSVLCARRAFDISDDLFVPQAILLRTGGALLGFMIIAQGKRIGLLQGFRSLGIRDRGTVVAVSLLGTFMALCLGFAAVKVSHLASIAAIGMTGPFFGGIFEHALKRKIPGKYFWLAFAFFCAGFWVFVTMG